ncbi:hypothetical protein BGW37DRAFT_479753 [Umbelopsis sp. PMI_123]|nr:hypothetical protein BGW37DRAFT_479753 [Umbelopsis sp. PMI_123]
MFTIKRPYIMWLLPLLLISMVQAQSISNPFFLQTEWVYNASDIRSGFPLSNTSVVASSQLFQTVSPFEDQNTSQVTDRILLNFGTACNATTNFTTIQALNNNVISSVSNASIIALIERSSGCFWAEKIATAQSISSANNLTLSAALIYDNVSYPNTNPMINNTTGTTSTPNYPMPLPAVQNISDMPDNNINPNDLTLAVYFISNAYGTSLSALAAAANVQSANTDGKKVWLVRPVLSPTCWTNCSDGLISTLSAQKGYLIYIIALAAIFLIAAILLRWYRMRRFSQQLASRGDVERGIPMQSRLAKVHPLPVDILNTYPIEKYSPSIVKNGSCAICLDDFTPEREDIRVLPCGHGFCTGCIDPWLTDKSPLCPICKHDCLPPELRKHADVVEQNNNNVQLGTASPFNSPSAAAAAALASTSTPSQTDINHSATSPPAEESNLTTETNNSATSPPAEESNLTTETNNHEQVTDMESTSVDHQNVEETHMTTTPPHPPQDSNPNTDTNRPPVTQ